MSEQREPITPEEQYALDAVDLKELRPRKASKQKGKMRTENELPAPSFPANDPCITDVSWTQFVLKHFDASELDQVGRPSLVGLRRVARILLGPVIYSAPKIVLAPTSTFLYVTVEYNVRFLWCRSEDNCDGGKAYEVDFGAAASGKVCDAYDPQKIAEGRALCKALALNTDSAEEPTTNG